LPAKAHREKHFPERYIFWLTASLLPAVFLETRNSKLFLPDC
jgi:hypothetical protein